MRATVLFPLPLSPTRATTFPGYRAKLTSSLAWSMIFVLQGHADPPTLKCLLRLRTSRIGSLCSGSRASVRTASAYIAHSLTGQVRVVRLHFGRQSLDSLRLQICVIEVTRYPMPLLHFTQFGQNLHLPVEQGRLCRIVVEAARVEAAARWRTRQIRGGARYSLHPPLFSRKG